MCHGSGRVRVRLFAWEEGVEPDAGLVTSTDRPDGTIHLARFDAGFQPGKTYRLIVMLDVLEHLPDARAGLRHALSLLDPDGVLLITVPAFRLLWTTHDDLNRHVTRYTRSTFTQLAADAGMRLDALRYFYHWLFPLKIAVRIKEASFPRNPEPPKIPGALVNRVCYGVSRFEQHLFRHCRLPFGSSLLAVGGHPREPADGPCRSAPQSLELSSV